MFDELSSLLLAEGKSLPNKSTISVYSDNDIFVNLFYVFAAIYSIIDDFPTPGMPSRSIDLSNYNPLTIFSKVD